MDLKCRKLDCVNNDRYSCTKRGINISKETECKSYEKSKTLGENQKQDVSRDMFSKKPDIHPYRHNKTVDIECKAHCLFNREGKCFANGVTIQNTAPKEADCITYIKQ